MQELYYGRGSDDENERLIDFLDEIFFENDKKPFGFRDLLPKIYKPESRPAHNNFIVRQSDGKFRAAVGTFYNEFSAGSETLRAYCIGNVGVGKKYRSMGYMKELMNIAVDDMIKSDADFAYLGGNRHRYAYFGFEPGGIRYRFCFHRDKIKHSLGENPSSLSVKPLQKNDEKNLEFIKNLYEKNPVHSVRKNEELFYILRSWNRQPYVFFDGEKPIGYFMCKGNIGFAAEFTLTEEKYFPDAVKSIFEMSEEKEIAFFSAEFEKEKLEFLIKNADEYSLGCDEASLILNFKKCVTALLKAKASYEKLCDGEISFLIHGLKGDEKFTLGVKDNSVRVADFSGEAQAELNLLEAERLFFAPASEKRKNLPPEIQQWFPLPMYIFEADKM